MDEHKVENPLETAKVCEKCVGRKWIKVLWKIRNKLTTRKITCPHCCGTGIEPIELTIKEKKK